MASTALVRPSLGLPSWSIRTQLPRDRFGSFPFCSSSQQVCFSSAYPRVFIPSLTVPVLAARRKEVKSYGRHVTGLRVGSNGFFLGSSTHFCSKRQMAPSSIKGRESCRCTAFNQEPTEAGADLPKQYRSRVVRHSDQHFKRSCNLRHSKDCDGGGEIVGNL